MGEIIPLIKLHSLTSRKVYRLHDNWETWDVDIKSVRWTWHEDTDLNYFNPSIKQQWTSELVKPWRKWNWGRKPKILSFKRIKNVTMPMSLHEIPMITLSFKGYIWSKWLMFLFIGRVSIPDWQGTFKQYNLFWVLLLL